MATSKKKEVLYDYFSENLGVAWKMVWIYMLNKSVVCLFGTFWFWLLHKKNEQQKRRI